MRRGTAGGWLPRAALLALVGCSPLLAVNPNLPVNQYLHTTWTQEEGGAPPSVLALAQTDDGYLWLGTGNGLIRFDGTRFTEWTPLPGESLPGTNISSLRAARGGGLWIGTFAGLGRLKHGHLTRYSVAGKLPCGVIADMQEDRQGRLWILNVCPQGNTLAMLSAEGTLRVFGADDGVPRELMLTLYRDSQDRLWIGTASGICQWAPGSQAVCSKSPAMYVVGIAETAQGELAVADGRLNQGWVYANGQARPLGPRAADCPFMPRTMVGDRDGNIWIGTFSCGLLRLRANAVDRLTRNEGLSNNSVSGVLEDREGDLWVATARGLDRIRDPKVQIYSTLNGLSSDFVNTVYGARDGSVWIGMARGGLNQIAGERVTPYPLPAGMASATVLSLYEDPHGRVWVGTNGGLAVYYGDRFSTISAADGRPFGLIPGISGDPSGGVWVVDVHRGLFAIRGSVAQPVPLPIAPNDSFNSLLVTRQGSVWVGFLNSGITVLENGSARHYDRAGGLAGGLVRALYEDREGNVWAGTGEGLSRFRDGRWTTWTTALGLPDGGVQSMVEDNSGYLWLLTRSGVMRVGRGSLTGPAESLQYVKYGWNEGLRLLISGAMTSPRLTRSRDGRLWVSTEEGVAAIDPTRVKGNPVAPPVEIEQVLADGQAVDPASAREIVFRGHDLQITYTGVSLVAPEEVRFRYRLAGLDNSLIDAGTRRSVTYAHLSPGSYTFEVTAANNDGVWNTAGAELKLRVVPYFYQTRWFASLCIASLLLAVWSAHRLRVRRVVARFKLIAAERARFSRELHDSLLQGFSGVVYQLEAAARQFEAAPEVSKQRLTRALDQADQSLREARQMIVSMRIPALENSTLPEALKTSTIQMVSGMGIDYQFDVRGHVRQAPYDMEANLFLIAREALNNSLNHASATRIRMELCYTHKELHLTVQDNGVGFEPAMALAKAGHWGFRGMNERARQIGARFDVESAPGRGSRIDVAIPWKN